MAALIAAAVPVELAGWHATCGWLQTAAMLVWVAVGVAERRR